MYIRTTQSSESGFGEPPDWSSTHPPASRQRQPVKKDRVPILLARLKQVTNAEIKFQIIRTLGNVGSASTSDQVKQSIVTELIREMETATNTEVKIAAIQALEKIPLDSATEPLLKQFRQETDRIKLPIIYALRNVGSASTSDQVKQSIVAELIREMETNTGQVQEAAILALEKIPLKSATEPLLKQLKQHLSIEYLTQIIIRALGEIRDPRAVELLVIMLEKHKSYSVRGEAANALWKIGGPKARAALSKLPSVALPREGGLRWRTSPPPP